MRTGFWNVRGWNHNRDSANYNLRDACIKQLDLDIIGIAETHLTSGAVLDVDDYQWFGNNRHSIHMRARTGSGGVGFLIHKDLLVNYDVVLADNSVDGIVWLHMKHKSQNISIYPCLCYLPPENSCRHVDVHAFYDTILTDIYKYQNEGIVYICGDFNSRCGDNPDT